METLYTGGNGQFVVFSLQGQAYALGIEEVVEIIRVQPITEVPMIKDYIAGVINLRGKIIPVVNLRKRFNLPSVPFDKKNRIVVVHYEEEQIGLIVDEIKRVASIEGESMEKAPDLMHTFERECFHAFAKADDGLIGILNIERVFAK